MILDLRRNNGIVFESYSRAHEKEKPAFSNSSGLKSVFEKLHFRDGLVWTVGLTVEIKLCYQIPPAYCGQDLNQIRFCYNFPSPDCGSHLRVFLD